MTPAVEAYEFMINKKKTDIAHMLRELYSHKCSVGI